MTRPTRVHGDSGNATVEIAIVLPLLVMLLFGIYAVSRAYNAKTELTGAVREGVRASALTKDTNAIEQAVINASPGLALPAANITIEARPSSSQTTPWVLGDCRTAGMVETKVKATYTIKYSTPLWQGDKTITAEGVMRCGL